MPPRQEQLPGDKIKTAHPSWGCPRKVSVRVRPGSLWVCGVNGRTWVLAESSAVKVLCLLLFKKRSDMQDVIDTSSWYPAGNAKIYSRGWRIHTFPEGGWLSLNNSRKTTGCWGWLAPSSDSDSQTPKRRKEELCLLVLKFWTIVMVRRTHIESL